MPIIQKVVRKADGDQFSLYVPTEIVKSLNIKGGEHYDAIATQGKEIHFIPKKQ